MLQGNITEDDIPLILYNSNPLALPYPGQHKNNRSDRPYTLPHRISGQLNCNIFLKSYDDLSKVHRKFLIFFTPSTDPKEGKYTQYQRMVEARSFFKSILFQAALNLGSCMVVIVRFSFPKDNS